MPLTPGTRLGPYEILAPLGAGGMGEVYRARDTRLGRDVAVKVLPQHLGASAEVRARFEREARTVSALNHPNICTLFDVGREGETDYLVMELVDGETLAQRLARGALPVADVLRIGAQVADGLDRAHRAGVVHRDLKPGNVMLTKSGAKLMDFGLARATGLAGASGSGSVAATLTQSPTVAAPLTAEGTIVGTFQYMAPEQLEGRETDARSDIWAFGCVLYEMATGRRAFEGTTQASLIGAIMRDTPRPMAELAPMSPPALERVVGQCLSKDPDDRWQSAGDVKRALEWSAGPESLASAATPARRAPAARAPWPAIAGALGAGAVLTSGAGWWLAPRPPRPAAAVLDLPVAPGMAMSDWPGNLAISPDGRWLAYVAADSSAVDHLWVRALDAPAPRRIEGSARADHPFWSPDSRWIGFCTSGDGAALRKVPVEGGAPIKLCDLSWSRGAAWGRNGDILLSPGPGTPLVRIASIGGALTPATLLDSTRGETSHRNPSFLPDGEHFVYAALPGTSDGWDLHLGSLRSRKTKRLGVATSAATWVAPGYLLFDRDGQLVAQRLDPRKLELVGDVIPISATAPRGGEDASRVATASTNGRIALLRADPPVRHFEWYGRAGQRLAVLPIRSDLFNGPVLSHDARQAAVVRTVGGVGQQAMRVDLGRGIVTALTEPRGYNIVSCWSSDDRMLALSSVGESGREEIALMPADGSSPPRVLPTTDAQFKGPVAWTPDGKTLVINQIVPGTGRDLFLLDAERGGTPRPFVTDNGSQVFGSLSPDGRWLAYDSDETGVFQVFVRRVPDGSGKMQLSPAGGSQPIWTRGGREVVFIGADRRTVYGLAFEPGRSPVPEDLKPLFRLPFDLDGYASLDVTADGERFLVLAPEATQRAPSATVIVDWTALLEKHGR